MERWAHSISRLVCVLGGFPARGLVDKSQLELIIVNMGLFWSKTAAFYFNVSSPGAGASAEAGELP